jgi:uncharacterized protein Yka (UPF0111/DUF47 family)
MSENITMQQFTDVLDLKIGPILESLTEVKSQVSSARTEISEQVTNYAVLNNEFTNHKIHQEKELASIVDSNNKNWNLTRQINKDTEAILPKIDNNEKDIDEIKRAAKAHLEVTTSLRSKVVKWGGIALGISGSLTAILSVIKIVEFLK